jgi:nucleotide-binding universal stress UspA family protein
MDAADSQLRSAPPSIRAKDTTTYRRVLVPLDGSPEAEAVLPALRRLARPLDMEVILLRVVSPLPVTAVEGAGTTAVNAAMRARDEAEQYLAALTSRWNAEGIRAVSSVRVGEASAEIAAGAREAGADLIAMATHGRSGIGRLLFGSVAQEVLWTAEVPVFLVRLGTASATERAA